MKSPQILLVSDLHFRRQWYAWVAELAMAGKFDVICLAGDLLDMRPVAADPLDHQVEWVLAWFARFPRGGSRFVAVTGNHDWWTEGEYCEGCWLQRARRRDRIFADGDSAVIGGFNFTSVPWAAPVQVSSCLPTILVAHAPPESCKVSRSLGDEHLDCGDIELRLVAENELPATSIVLSGHQHTPIDCLDRVGPCVVLNAGCDLSAAVPHHIAIDTGTRRIRHVVGNRTAALRRY